ncbi:hypothetical protein V1477_002417 [Vespula maculifrons]|uniref:Uncharacterized protein n=1 Tax=Vespula maculifrons TaxID=7453 RepID=A0ABD2CWN5_VESMC
MPGRASESPAGPQIQQPPSGGTWVGSTCNTLKLCLNYIKNANTGRIGRTLTPLSAGRDVVFAGANKSPTDMDSVSLQKRMNDRSC